MLVNQSKAARLAGVSRTTINKKVKSGELSVNDRKQIDTAELIRVFGEIRNDDPAESSSGGQVGVQMGVQVDYLNKRIADLEQMNAELRQDRERMRDEIERLHSQVDKLIDQNRPRNLLQLLGWDR